MESGVPSLARNGLYAHWSSQGLIAFLEPCEMGKWLFPQRKDGSGEVHNINLLFLVLNPFKGHFLSI